VAHRKSYITPQGMEKLRAEADHLWRVERPRVTREVSDAAAQGDRSENAEYIYGKKRLREIDSRLRFLNRRMEQLEVVEAPPERRDRVFFGAWVTLEDEEGETVRYRLVGPDESDAASRRISIESPMGRALLGRALDDEVTVRRPKGEAVFTIVAIAYGDGAE
jgi:transcription elongation factor GreB